MTIYFAGNEFEAFTIGTPGSWSFSTAATTYDSAITRGGMLLVNDRVPYLQGNLISTAAAGWISFHVYVGLGGGNGTTTEELVSLWDSTKKFLRIIGSGTLTLQESTNGSSWTTIGSAISWVTGLHTVSLQWDLSGSGTFGAWLDGTLIAQVNQNNTSYASSCASFRLGIPAVGGGSGGANYSVYFSQVMVSDVDNRAWKLKTIYPSGAGSNSAWNGAYSDVNGNGVPADSTLITATAANLKESFAVTDVGASQYSAYGVKSLVTSLRAERDSSGNAPTKLEHLVRRSSTDYFSADQSPGTSFGPNQVVWDTDPSTSAAWALANFGSGFELGVKSIT